MLWRAYQGLRHCYHATLAHAARARPCPTASRRVPLPVQPMQRVAAAHSLHASPDTNHPPLDAHAEQPQRPSRARRKDTPSPKSKSLANPHRDLQQPVPELVDMVDALFALRRTRKLTSHDLRDWPEGLRSAFTDTKDLSEAAMLMVNTSLPQRALHLLQITHDMGRRPPIRPFENVAYQLSLTAQWALIPHVATLAKRLSDKSSVRLLNFRARALLELRRYELLDEVLDGFREAGLKPNQRTYQTILKGYIRNRDLAKARECLQKMEEAGLPLNASTHASIASAYRSLGADKDVITDALDALPSLHGSAGTVVLNSLLQLTLDTGDLAGALQYLSRFYGPANYSSPSASSGAGTTPPGGEDASSHTIKPDATTFTMLLNFLAKERNLPLALQMLARMKMTAASPDSAVAAAVIRVHCTSGDLYSGLCIASRMCEDVPATRPIFQWLGSRKLRRIDILPQGIALTADALNALLEPALRTRGIAAMRAIVHIMRHTGLEPNAETVTIFLKYLRKVERATPQQLLMVLRQLSATIPATHEHIGIVFRALYETETVHARRRGWWAVWRGVHHKSAGPAKTLRLTDDPRFAASAGLSPHTRTQRRFLRPIMRTLTRHHIREDRAMLALRIQHDAVVRRDMRSACATLDSMLSRGMHASKHHVAALMQGYTLAGDMRNAQKVFASIRAAHILPNKVLYTILVSGYARLGRPSRAMHTFRKMAAAGIEPDKAAIDALAGAWFAVGAIRMARRVLIELWSYVAPFPEELKNASTHTLLATFRKLPEDEARKTRKPLSARILRWKLLKLTKLWIAWSRRHRRSRQHRRSGHSQPERSEHIASAAEASHEAAVPTSRVHST